LVVSVMLAVGVKVAVQVMPPSLLLTAQVPLAMVRSALVKPVTASLKVMVTSEVRRFSGCCRPPRWSPSAPRVDGVKLPSWWCRCRRCRPGRRCRCWPGDQVGGVVDALLGVKVAVQVMPSLLLTALKVPLELSGQW
jgi:hypothetical protein